MYLLLDLDLLRGVLERGRFDNGVRDRGLLDIGDLERDLRIGDLDRRSIGDLERRYRGVLDRDLLKSDLPRFGDRDLRRRLGDRRGVNDRDRRRPGDRRLIGLRVRPLNGGGDLEYDLNFPPPRPRLHDRLRERMRLGERPRDNGRGDNDPLRRYGLRDEARRGETERDFVDRLGAGPAAAAVATSLAASCSAARSFFSRSRLFMSSRKSSHMSVFFTSLQQPSNKPAHQQPSQAVHTIAQ